MLLAMSIPREITIDSILKNRWFLSFQEVGSNKETREID
jgi:hypothetical protein